MLIKLIDEHSNINGLKYSKECLETIAEQLKDKELLGEFGQKDIKNSCAISVLDACVSYKNFRISDKGLEADVKFIGNKKESLENGLIDFEFGLRALGKIENDAVKDLQVITFDLIQK